MKKILLFLTILLSTIPVFAEGGESAKPSFGVCLERKADVAFIEDKTFYNVLVEIDAADIGDIFATGVKVTVRDADKPKKKIYKKRFSNSYLYGFSDGSIMIGKGNVLTQLVLSKSSTGHWIMKLKEKGIY